jgi:FMNH2-dependent dimethyl sulfone monooxygenase
MDPMTTPDPVRRRHRPLRIGLLLPTAAGSLEGRTPRWKDYLELVRLAEDVGFDSIWVPDELLWRTPGLPTVGWWHGWSIISAIAAVTARVEIGTLVTCTNDVGPALLAKAAETVDEISDGRFTLGLGAGWSAPQFRAFGLPADHLVDRFSEAVAIIHGLLRAGRISYRGRYYQVEDAELLGAGPRPGRVPILVGGRGPRILELAARYADAWNAFLVGRGSPDEIPPLHNGLDASCRAIGRDPATLRRSAAVIVSPDRRSFVIGQSDWGDRALGGSPEEIAAQILAFGHAGIDELQLGFLPTSRASLEGFGRVLELIETDAGTASVSGQRAAGTPPGPPVSVSRRGIY